MTARSILFFEIGNLELDALNLLSLLANLADTDLDTNDGLLELEVVKRVHLRVVSNDPHFLPLNPVGDNLALLVNILQLAEHVAVSGQELNLDVRAEAALSGILRRSCLDLGDVMARVGFELIDHGCEEQWVGGFTYYLDWHLPKLSKNGPRVLTNFQWLHLLKVQILELAILREDFSARNITVKKSNLFRPICFIKLNCIIWINEGVDIRGDAASSRPFTTTTTSNFI